MIWFGPELANMGRRAKTRCLDNIQEGGKYCSDLYLPSQEVWIEKILATSKKIETSDGIILCLGKE